MTVFDTVVSFEPGGAATTVYTGSSRWLCLATAELWVAFFRLTHRDWWTVGAFEQPYMLRHWQGPKV